MATSEPSALGCIQVALYILVTAAEAPLCKSYDLMTQRGTTLNARNCLVHVSYELWKDLATLTRLAVPNHSQAPARTEPIK